MAETHKNDTNIPSDQILRRIPIILNKPINQSLFNLSYPLRTQTRPYFQSEDLEIQKVLKFKPKTKQLQMEFSVRDDSIHFNEQNSFPKKELRLKSRYVENKSNYAFCTLINGKIIMTPIESSFQMLPDFSYITEKTDKVNFPPSASTPTSKANLSTKDETEKSAKKPAEPEQITSVIQKLKRSEKSSNMAKFSFFKDHLNAVESEKAQKLSPKSVPETLKSAKKASEAEFPRVIPGLNPPLQFLAKLKAEEEKFSFRGNSETQSRPRQITPCLSNDSIRFEIKNFDLKVVAALKNMGTASFDTLKKMFFGSDNPNDSTENHIEVSKKSLCKMGHFLHGVWLLKSEFLHQRRKRFARDLLVADFAESLRGKVRRCDWNRLAKLSHEDSRQMMEEIAVFDKQTRFWTLKNMVDSSSAGEDFGELSGTSQQIRETQRNNIQRLRLIAQRVLKLNHRNTNPKTNAKDIKTSKKELAVFLEETFLKFSVCSKEFLCAKLEKRVREGGLESFLVFVTEKDLAERLGAFCHGFEGEIYIKKDCGNALNDKVRKSIVKCLKSKKSIPKEELVSYVRQTIGEEPPSQLQRLISELAVLSGSKSYKLKSGFYRL